MFLILLAHVAFALEPAVPADLSGPNQWLGGEWKILAGDPGLRAQEHDLEKIWNTMPYFGAARFTASDSRVELQANDAACEAAVAQTAKDAEVIARLSLRAPAQRVFRRFRWLPGNDCVFEVDVLIAAKGRYGDRE